MEINLKEYIMMIKKRLWIVVLFVLASTMLTAFYSTVNYQPVYMAATKLIVNKTSEKDMTGKEQIDYAAIGVNIALINTYKEIIKTPAIMDKVVQRYPDLNLSAEQLIAMTNVSDLHETQVMTIVAQSGSYEKAVKIANAVSDVFQTEIPKIMKVDNVTILNRAKMQDNPVPINKKSNQYIVLSFAASLVISIGIIFLLEALDDTVKTEDDVREMFGASTLALIPKLKDKEINAGKRSKSRRKVGEVAHAKTIQ
ncbi:Wzz/FepE/Etk N-terminal domain-containing protein [Paenibacillus doosanensis]|uniref:Capsular polysaccharide type 8 biosynthesis protein cap8A n=2 Tax=Paenibacillus konkukensis TaxID=2020716 RepID=A0ABY4RV01_9BACL|nr:MULTISPECIES: Wzz/FepE/Etk N-terminal domain-containing protein [Paenibacillus]MCS7461004.1 Wzz/FepE/Etk N-terminal domain-containing protein [Paenibacillus doosanensis]UQZ85675.1 Capsular polysaccharide type 8 biosynthesis protein cap8A [Paenibacillus konkukensis]